MARALRDAAAAAVTLAALLCGSIAATGQDPAPPAPDRSAILAAARELMGKARYCTLVTVGPEGHPQARIVDPLAPEKEDWAPFYKDRNRGDDFVLIRVEPRRLEIVSEAHGLLNDAKTWRPLSLDFE